MDSNSLISIGDWLVNIAVFLLGVPSATLASILLVTSLYLMARHSILLYGRVERLEEASDASKRRDESATKRANETLAASRLNRTLYRYSFFIQNIEDVPWPSPLVVNICAPKSCIRLARENVLVFAGPKPVDFTARYASEHNSFVAATLRFAALPAYDTWRIDCITDAKSLALSISGPRSGPYLKRALVMDIWPRRLELDVVGKATSSEGGALAPRTFFFWLMWPATLLAYLASIILIGGHSRAPKDFVHLNSWDAFALLALSLLLWIVFRRIQRDVYPIMQGYLEETVLQETGECESAESASSDESTSKSSG